MLISLSATIGSCLASALLGYLVAIYFGRASNSIAPSTDDVRPTTAPETNCKSGIDSKEVDHLVSTLHELTSSVDVQVGEHTSRVQEITDQLTTSSEVNSTIGAVTGRLLVTANRKLQNDLVEAKQEIQRQREVMTTCMLESQTDALTGIANRRGLDFELVRSFALRRRTGMTFSLLFIDIDHFKHVNVKYGHMVGDQLLRSFARYLTATFRESDFVARFGGEEFVVILPQTTIEDACHAADRVRTVLSENKHNVGELDLLVTASIGVKEVYTGETEEELIQRADRALYAAKNGGRNCTYYHDGMTCHRYIPSEDDVDGEDPFELKPAALLSDDTVVIESSADLEQILEGCSVSRA